MRPWLDWSDTSLVDKSTYTVDELEHSGTPDVLSICARGDGEPDPDVPVLESLPLPVPNGGQEAAMYGFPEEGTAVVVCFAYGLPHKPFIQRSSPRA